MTGNITTEIVGGAQLIHSGIFLAILLLILILWALLRKFLKCFLAIILMLFIGIFITTVVIVPECFLFIGIENKSSGIYLLSPDVKWTMTMVKEENCTTII